MADGYCVRCKKKTEMANSEEVIIQNPKGNKKAVKGKCPTCGTNMFKITGKA